MRRLAQISGLAVVLLLAAVSGCSGYRPASYSIIDPGGIAVVEVQGDTYQDKGLIGVYCKLRLVDQTEIVGRVLDVTETDFLLKVKWSSSPTKPNKGFDQIVSKRDIVEFELQKETEGGSVAGLFVASALIGAIYWAITYGPRFN